MRSMDWRENTRPSVRRRAARCRRGRPPERHAAPRSCRRPTPPASAPGAGPQYAYMTPWVMLSSSQFRPAGPPALNSAKYTAEFNETKSMGRFDSPLRTADQTIYAWFWAQSSAAYLWNHLA